MKEKTPESRTFEDVRKIRRPEGVDTDCRHPSRGTLVANTGIERGCRGFVASTESLQSTPTPALLPP